MDYEEIISQLTGIDPDEEGQDRWEIEKIQDHKLFGKKIYILIKWRDCV